VANVKKAMVRTQTRLHQNFVFAAALHPMFGGEEKTFGGDGAGDVREMLGLMVGHNLWSLREIKGDQLSTCALGVKNICVTIYLPWFWCHERLPVRRSVILATCSGSNIAYMICTQGCVLRKADWCTSLALSRLKPSTTFLPSFPLHQLLAMMRSNAIVTSTLVVTAAGASAYFFLGNRISAAFKRQEG